MGILGFETIELFEKPTPLQKLDNLGFHIGLPNLYLKRDDHMLLGLGGNKLRNLEYWLAQAKEQKADIVLAAGGLQSNQCRLTAAACAKLGLRCRIYHNALKPQVLEGNALLNHLLGAETYFWGPISEEERGIRVKEEAQVLSRQGFKPYIIGDSALGALGYAQAAQELALQNQKLSLGIHRVFIVGAMCVTATGFLYGTALLGAPFQVHVVSVEYPLTVMKEKIDELWRQIIAKTENQPALHYSQFTNFTDSTLGVGYAIPTKESLSAIKLLASQEGIFLEQVYGAKTLAALISQVKAGSIKENEKVCLFHTGGYGALFSQSFTEN